MAAMRGRMAQKDKIWARGRRGGGGGWAAHAFCIFTLDILKHNNNWHGQGAGCFMACAWYHGSVCMAVCAVFGFLAGFVQAGMTAFQ